jgi:hypothetical protein
MIIRIILLLTNRPVLPFIQAAAFTTIPYPRFSKFKKDTTICLSSIDWIDSLQDWSFMASQSKNPKSFTNKIKMKKWRRCTLRELMAIFHGIKKLSTQRLNVSLIKMEFTESLRNFNPSRKRLNINKIKLKAKRWLKSEKRVWKGIRKKTKKSKVRIQI